MKWSVNGKRGDALFPRSVFFMGLVYHFSFLSTSMGSARLISIYTRKNKSFYNNKNGEFRSSLLPQFRQFSLWNHAKFRRLSFGIMFICFVFGARSNWIGHNLNSTDSKRRLYFAILFTHFFLARTYLLKTPLKDRSKRIYVSLQLHSQLQHPFSHSQSITARFIWPISLRPRI